MFTQLATFFKQTNAKKVHITVTPNTNGSLSVVVGGSFPEGDVTKDNEVALTAKANLAQPLVIQGQDYEIESNIEQLIASLTETNKEQSDLFYSNVSSAGTNQAKQHASDEKPTNDSENGVSDTSEQNGSDTNTQTNTDEDGL